MNYTNFKSKFLVLFFLVAITQPFISKAQNHFSVENRPVRQGGSIEKQKTEWNTFKVDEKGNNAISGVEFFSKKGFCNSEKVNFVKLINTNNYAVKVSYQISAESEVVYVTVPASVTIEGSCEATDGNVSKLVIKALESDEAKQKAKVYMRSHLTVSKL